MAMKVSKNISPFKKGKMEACTLTAIWQKMRQTLTFVCSWWNCEGPKLKKSLKDKFEKEKNLRQWVWYQLGSKPKIRRSMYSHIDVSECFRRTILFFDAPLCWLYNCVLEVWKYGKNKWNNILFITYRFNQESMDAVSNTKLYSQYGGWVDKRAVNEVRRTRFESNWRLKRQVGEETQYCDSKVRRATVRCAEQWESEKGCAKEKRKRKQRRDCDS